MRIEGWGRSEEDGGGCGSLALGFLNSSFRGADRHRWKAHAFDGKGCLRERVQTEGMDGRTPMCCGSRMVGAQRVVWRPR